MSDTQTDTPPDSPPDSPPEVTLVSLAYRLDMLGKQMDWLCENLQSLFFFVQQAGKNGGGIRGMLAALKQSAPVVEPLNQEISVSEVSNHE